MGRYLEYIFTECGVVRWAKVQLAILHKHRHSGMVNAVGKMHTNSTNRGVILILQIEVKQLVKHLVCISNYFIAHITLSPSFYLLRTDCCIMLSHAV